MPIRQLKVIMDRKVTEAKSFNLEIDAVASKKDNFAMYFTEDGTNNFTQDNAVWRDIKGGHLTEKYFSICLKIEFLHKSD